MDDVPLIVGHEWAVDLLTRSLASDRLSQAYLFVGPQHIGKTTLALYLARALNCTDAVRRPCGKCSVCRRIGQGLHPDVREIDGAGSRIKIDQIRELQRQASLSPFEGRWRVNILCEFERATVEAANCLLKVLEEPPPRVVLILTSDKVESLLPTIVSRCQILRLRALPLSQVQHALETHWGQGTESASQLARLSQGRMGWAVRAGADDQLLRDREKHLVTLEQALHEGVTQRFGLAKLLSQRAAALPSLLCSWESWWRDILLANSGCADMLANVDRVQTLTAEARHFGAQETLDTLYAIQQCGKQVEENVNACLALEVLLLKMPRLERSE